jgi:hypothetical protein
MSPGGGFVQAHEEACACEVELVITKGESEMNRRVFYAAIASVLISTSLSSLGNRPDVQLSVLMTGIFVGH